jgi:hypothetical protein
MVLAQALILNEDASTYAWVLEQMKTIMGGRRHGSGRH